MLEFVAAAVLACPPLPDTPTTPEGTVLIQGQNTWGVVPTEKRHSEAPIPSGGPGTVGTWGSPMKWDVIAIHAMVLPTGEVLHYAYPQSGTGSMGATWSPDGGFKPFPIETDIFCSGHSQLADGRIYTAGGNDTTCEFRGRRVTHIFNPFLPGWTQLEDMVDGRWYPSNITMPDGTVMIFSGYDLECEINPYVERFTPGVGLEYIAGVDRSVDLYPRMHILSDGRIAHVGAEQTTHTFDLDNGWQYITNSQFGYRAQGTSVLLPGFTDRIMIIGGASPLTATTEIIDFGDSSPSYSWAAPMNIARSHADALILPDKTVLVMGGGWTDLYDDPVNTPELYDPATNTWTLLAPHEYGRMYHATTVLLPDGRVLVAGQDSGMSAYTGELYSPPYLFRGDRPQISTAPESSRRGRSFSIATPEAASIDSVVAIRLSSVTHSVNFEQRLIELPFTDAGDGTLTAMVPANPNLTPPGYYMLFILTDGIPSESTMLRIDAAVPGDVNDNDIVTFADLLALLAAWGPCSEPPVACPADFNLDGVVDFEDLLVVLASWT